MNLFWRSMREARIERRLAAIERRTQQPTDHLGIEESDVESPELLEHLRRGKKIQAIKVYCELTGAGLNDARAAVERIARKHHL